MGRPPNRSRTEGSNPLHHHPRVGGSLVACASASPEKPHFKNAKIRVGSQFQIKVPKFNANAISTPSTRPLPEKMSTEYPMVTETEVNQQMDVTNYDEELLGTTSQSEPSMTVCCSHDGPYSDRPPPSRGGICVHQPGEAASDFLSYARPLWAPLQEDTDEECFKQDMIQRYGGVPHSAAPSGRRGRGRPKRKREEVSPHDPGVHSSFSSSSVNAVVAPLEADAKVLEYLARRHGGNREAAQLAMLVDVSAGRATKARKILNKELYATRFRRPPTTCSQSWILRFERTYPDLLGDLRDDPSYAAFPYAIRGHVSQVSSIAWDSDDMKGIWRAVLACSQEMGKELRQTSGRSRYSLSEVTMLVQRAYGLPLPEEAFGTRHITVEGVSDSMHVLLDFVSKARDAQAKLIDLLFDESGEGVDTDAVQKYVDEVFKTCPLRLDEVEVVERQLQLIQDWNTRLKSLAADHEDDESDPMDTDEATGRDDLATAEQLAFDGRTKLAFCTKNLVALEKRIERAHRLRDRIRAWQTSREEGNQKSTKFVSGLVREANRINLLSPEISSLMDFHHSMVDWVDRANIAIRSRISLSEIESLIDRADSMTLDLSEYLDKLQSRQSLAREWIEELEEFVPCPYREDGSVDNLQWMSRMRQALRSTEKRELSQIHNLATEGTRIPVEIDSVKMLLTEIDAKNWSQKAKKWIPSGPDEVESTNFKRGKIEELRDHIEKAETFRDNLTISPEEKLAWSLEGEPELVSIVDGADDWYDKYEEFLEYDNRRTSKDRTCLSLTKLREIVSEMDAIYANIGSISSKMTRILSQAESWYETYADLLARCGLNEIEPSPKSQTPVTLEEMTKAVKSSESDLSLDLDEARQLKALADRVEAWTDKVEDAAPKRSKRVGKGKYSRGTRYSVDDLTTLINESKGLPIETDEDVYRLRVQLESVRAWRVEAQRDLREIATGFNDLREAIVAAYGSPQEFYTPESRDASDDADSADRDPLKTPDETLSTSSAGEEEALDMSLSAEEESQTDTASISGSDLGSKAPSRLGGGSSSVHRLVSTLLKSAKLTGVYTAEEEATEHLGKVSKWLLKSLEYVDVPKKVYDKKTFGPFDRFLQEALDLLAYRELFAADMDSDDESLVSTLSASWSDLLSDQLVRLQALQAHRDEFIEWCKTAKSAISGREKQPTLDALKKLLEQSHDFPSTAETVQKVRNFISKATKWTERTRERLESEKKLAFDEAKELFDEGDKLNVACDELKLLRNALRGARSWANRVKRSKVEQGSTQVANVKKLMDEHNLLLISMPTEVARLEQALQGYCLCRRPYEGFMIGCDGCEEWYHGSCIGVSESQAGRYEKYLCVRCSVKKSFNTSATTVAGVIRKWTYDRDLKKARQADAQRHQRKVRKETKEIEKLTEQAEVIKNEPSENASTEAVSEKASSETMQVETSEKTSPEAVNGETTEKASSEVMSVEPSVKASPEAVNGETTEQASSEVMSVDPLGEASPEAGNSETAEKASSEVMSVDSSEKASLEAGNSETAEKASSEVMSVDSSEKASPEAGNSETAKKVSSVVMDIMTSVKASPEAVVEITSSQAANVKNSEKSLPEAIISEASENGLYESDPLPGEKVSAKDATAVSRGDQPIESIRVDEGAVAVAACSEIAHAPLQASENATEETPSGAHPMETNAEEGTLNVASASKTLIVEEDDKTRKLREISEAIKACEGRLRDLTVVAEARTAVERGEDGKKALLRAWCVRIRSLVLSPSTEDIAQASRPAKDGLLSSPMLAVLQDAKTLGIAEVADVAVVEKGFHALAWCCRAMHLLSRKPGATDVKALLAQASDLKLPEDRSIRMMKSMLGRATQWQSKVGKALATKPGETKPINVDHLKALVASADEIPFELSHKVHLLNVIDDKGSRHCVCAGPHVGSFMLGCDKCDRWYHGQCVGLDKEAVEAMNNWHCPLCCNTGEPVILPQVTNPLEWEIVDDDSMDDSDSETRMTPPHIPIPEKLWPPFGLLGSDTAKEALGIECCLISDDTSALEETPLLSTAGNNATSVVPDVDMETADVTASESEMTGGEAKSPPLEGQKPSEHLNEEASKVLVLPFEANVLNNMQPPEGPSSFAPVEAKAVELTNPSEAPSTLGSAYISESVVSDKPAVSDIPEAPIAEVQTDVDSAVASTVSSPPEPITLPAPEVPKVPVVEIPAHSHGTRFKSRVLSDQPAAPIHEDQMDGVLFEKDSTNDENPAENTHSSPSVAAASTTVEVAKVPVVEVPAHSHGTRFKSRVLSQCVAPTEDLHDKSEPQSNGSKASEEKEAEKSAGDYSSVPSAKEKVSVDAGGLNHLPSNDYDDAPPTDSIRQEEPSVEEENGFHTHQMVSDVVIPVQEEAA